MSDSENGGVFENFTEQMKEKFVTKKKHSRKVEAMKRELVQKNEELQKMKAECEREKLKNDMVIAEKKIVERRLNEIELKLKLKTQEHDELLSHSVEPKRRKLNSDISDTMVTTKATTAEPTAVTTTMAATITTAQEAPLDLSKNIYNCYECIHKWAKEVNKKFSYKDTSGDYPCYRVDKSKAPDPKLKIKRFTNIDDYVKHIKTVHGWGDRDIKRGKCGIAFLIPWQEPDREYNYTPDGRNRCKICDARFDVRARYNQHFELEHADLDTITKTKLYDLWFKYADQPYARFEPENLERFKECDCY